MMAMAASPGRSRTSGLARSEAGPKRFYGMSAQVRLESNDYYEILERAQ
jgi:hypothetical protein